MHVVGWGIFRLPGERARWRKAEAQARRLLEAVGSSPLANSPSREQESTGKAIPQERATQGSTGSGKSENLIPGAEIGPIRSTTRPDLHHQRGGQAAGTEPADRQADSTFPRGQADSDAVMYARNNADEERSEHDHKQTNQAEEETLTRHHGLLDDEPRDLLSPVRSTAEDPRPRLEHQQSRQQEESISVGGLEVKTVAGRILIRDNKHSGPTLSFSSAEWEAFINAVKRDAFHFD